MGKSNVACCYYPTTVVFVDDSSSFLDNVILDLDEKISARSFSDPVESIGYLKNNALPMFSNEYLKPFNDLENIDWSSGSNVEHSYVDVDLFSIHKKVFDPKRFEHVTVVVVDYTMPGMSGLDLCRELKDYPFKFVMITGEATLDTAVQAFNEGLIDKFILKSDQDFTGKLNSAISELQKMKFEELSDTIIKNLIINNGSSLGDPIVSEFIKKFFEENSIVEYYLVSESGSFLTVDIKGKVGWLDIKSEEEMTEHTSIATDNYASKEVVDKLSSREYLLSLHTEDAHVSVGVEDWGSHLYPATKIKGDNGDYYYAYTENVKVESISANNIVSYEDFLLK